MDILQSASNATAEAVSGPVDLIGMSLRALGVPVPTDAVGSSEWMRARGLTREVQPGAARVAGETLGLLAPTVLAAKAPQVARGLLQMQANAAAPRNVNRGMSAGQRGIFGGELAKTADKAALDKAKQLEAAGTDARAIWRDTGWFKGGDGKWRFEIDDSGTMFNTSTRNGVKVQNDIPVPYGDVDVGPTARLIEHVDLIKAYGDDLAPSTYIRNNPSMMGEYQGSFDDVRNAINIYAPAKADAARSTALHELQHAVQKREGFPGGGLPQTAGGVDAYRRLAGEAEARAVQARMGMTAAQRRALFPLDSYDVPVNELIWR